MAFTKNSYALLSKGFSGDAPEIDGYKTADAIAAVEGAAYFNDIANELVIGRTILIVASDAHKFSKVTAVSPNVVIADV